MRPGIDPKVDYMFKRLFGREENKPLLIHLINAVLQPPAGGELVSLELLNPFSEADALDDKLAIVDIKARDQSGRLFHVEMQMLWERAWRQRALFYLTRLFQSQLREGQDYSELRPTIGIWFVNGILFPASTDWHLNFEMFDVHQGLRFSSEFAIHVLELAKYRKPGDEVAGPMEAWIYFLQHGDELDATSLPGPLQLGEIRRAMEELEMVSKTDIERERYEARLKLQRDRLSEVHSAREEGIECGELIGRIQLCEEVLRLPVSTRQALREKPIEELKKMLNTLLQQLPRL
jgi:predicted transposase/invertase (TIGR01784 family)